MKGKLSKHIIRNIGHQVKPMVEIQKGQVKQITQSKLKISHFSMKIEK